MKNKKDKKKTSLKKLLIHMENAAKKPFRKARAMWLVKRIPLKKDTSHYVAHRGLSALAPENTVRAFEMAAERKFHAMETDIRRSKDKKLVLMHDASLKRMCGIDILVGDLTYEELREIPITGGRRSGIDPSDNHGLYIPLLTEYLVICKNSGMVPMMELKDNWDIEEPLADDYLEDIISQVKKIMGDSPVIFKSFNLNTVLKMQSLLKEDDTVNATLFHLIKKIRGLDLSWYRRQGINLSIQGRANKLKDIRRARREGIKLVVWTVDDPVEARLYVREKVSWLASNRQLWN